MSLSHAPHPRRSLVTTLVAVATAALLLPLSAFPAAAAPLRPGPYFERPAPFDNSGEFDPECRGLDLTVTFEASGVESVRHVLGSGGQAFFGRSRVRFREVWTDNTTGQKLFRIDGRFLGEETAARRVPRRAVPERLIPEGGLKGPVFEFTDVQTGGDVIRDPDGTLLYWSAGRLVGRHLFDTHGDSRPGGTSLRFRVVRSIGHHPLLDRDICEVAEEQIAAP